MLNNASGFEKVYIACGYSDLRRGIDGFANLIQQEFKLDPFQSGTLFLFCGRKTDRIKGILWEGDGFLLLYKRLETGKFQWPRNEAEVKAITPQQYKWLMEGISIEQKKAIKHITPSRVL
jgi:transposase